VLLSCNCCLFIITKLIDLNSLFYSKKEPYPLEKKDQRSALKTALIQIYSLAETLYFSVTGSLTAEADFMPSLKKESCKQIFEGTQYEHLKFEKALSAYRRNIQGNLKNKPLSKENREISRKIITQKVLPKAYKILFPYLPKEYLKIPLSQQFDFDRKWIGLKAHKAGQGVLNREFSKLSGEIGAFFDPHKNGNLPFLLGTRKINGSKVNILRIPVPTIEMGYTKVSEEFRAFLEDCRVKKEKVLYCCLLNSAKSRESKLIRELYKLGSEYKDVFHFIRIPLDGTLSKVDDGSSFESYRSRIEMDISKEVRNPQLFSNQFIFGSQEMAQVVSEKYRAISLFASQQINEVYRVRESKSKGDAQELTSLLKEKKQAFMMLFCAILKTALIQKMKIKHYTNTCKDGIDRGAAHLTSDLVWDSFLTNSIKENFLKLRLNAAWPAFMAKTQPVIKERSEWMISFTRWVEGASELGLREKIAREYSRQIGVYINEKISFNDMF